MKARSVAFLLCAGLVLGAAVFEVAADPRGSHERGSRPHGSRVDRRYAGRLYAGRPHPGRPGSGRSQLRFGFSYGFPIYGYSYYGFYPAYAYPYSPYYYGYYPYGPGYYNDYVPDAGFVDLDVWPEEAEVWVGDRLLGTADDFDGYPDLLPLRPGRRTVTLRSPGYEDLRLRLEIVAGTRIRIRRDMVPLESE
ncbi:MAG TPA: hypothetical protein VGV60_02070 [Candidatus Polarisedimenticolia bacterium]|jgi:hypothetical protein|nr:hypothetical protein [Candidatus Polarisedimenticolia bacterium]